MMHAHSVVTYKEVASKKLAFNLPNIQWVLPGSSQVEQRKSSFLQIVWIRWMVIVDLIKPLSSTKDDIIILSRQWKKKKDEENLWWVLIERCW